MLKVILLMLIESVNVFNVARWRKFFTTKLHLLRLIFERVWKMLERERKQAEIRNELSREERLEWLMNEYGKNVARLAFTYTKQRQLSEDIAQEVFIKCYENLDKFRHESSYKTWVYRITVNLCKDKLRSWSFKNIVLTEFFLKTKSTNKSPEMELVGLEDKRIISEKILSLPIKYREVIILYYYEEMSYNQISDLLNVSLQTIKSRLHRARLLLKKLLEGSITDG
jgi:RNA polymerase sigma factor (sigma-70 family)